MSTEPTRIVPRRTALTEPYWEGCQAGELRLQRCRACNQYQFYPRILCSHCGHRELTWHSVAGRGKVASYTVVHRPVSAAYPAPAIIALVDLDEGPRMMSSLIECSPEDVTVGSAVAVDFQAWSEEISMPVFRWVREDSQA